MSGKVRVERAPRPAGPATPGLAVAGASLAALAEAVIAFPVVRLVALQLIPGAAGPLVNLPLFVAVFVGAAALATDLRRFPAMPAVAAVAAVALGMAQTQAWGRAAGPAADAVAVIVALILAFRVVTLALRDWREPADATLLVGSLVLLAEVLLSGAVGQGWPSAVSVAIPVFFVAALASRACSLWLAAPDAWVAASAAHGRRFAVRLLFWYAASILVALLIGGKGGPVGMVGALLVPAVAWMVSFLTLLVAQLARPIFWLADRIHINPASAQRALQQFRNSALNRTHVSHGAAGHLGTVQRLLGLLVLVAVASLLVRAIRRRQGPPGEANAPRDVDDDDVRVAPLPPTGRRWGRGSGGRTHELPADTVRRWYAELLLALRDLGLSKPGAQTPAEFLTVASAAYPQCRAGMEALTRAYEGVRYGNATLSRSALAELRTTRDQTSAALRRATPIPTTENQEEGGPPGA